MLSCCKQNLFLNQINFGEVFLHSSEIQEQSVIIYVRVVRYGVMRMYVCLETDSLILSYCLVLTFKPTNAVFYASGEPGLLRGHEETDDDRAANRVGMVT